MNITIRNEAAGDQDAILPGVPPEYVLALSLSEDEEVRGEVAYRQAFGICG